MSTTTKARERVIFIEYSGGRPFSVITRKPWVSRHDGSSGTSRQEYDVKWCKRDGHYYYHNSGGGGGDTITVSGCTDGSTRFWAAEGVKLKRGNDAKITRVKRARFKAKLEKELNGSGYSDLFFEGRYEYCPTCDDHLPCENTDTLCDHCWYCEESCEWSKPGERCDWDCDECRGYGGETKPELPKVGMDAVAEGYGIAASDLAMVSRKLLARYSYTPATLARRLGWCSEGCKAIAMATRGQVYDDISGHSVLSIKYAMKLTTDEYQELYEAFESAGYEL